MPVSVRIVAIPIILVRRLAPTTASLRENSDAIHFRYPQTHTHDIASAHRPDSTTLRHSGACHLDAATGAEPTTKGPAMSRSRMSAK
jgi:hypothetical protein